MQKWIIADLFPEFLVCGIGRGVELVSRLGFRRIGRWVAEARNRRWEEGLKSLRSRNMLGKVVG